MSYAVNSFKISQAQNAVNAGAMVSLHSAFPPTDANEIASTTRQITTWPTPTIAASGPYSGYATSQGSSLNFTLPASSSAVAFAVHSGSTLTSTNTILWGDNLTPGITLNANGPGAVTVVPTYVYEQ